MLTRDGILAVVATAIAFIPGLQPYGVLLGKLPERPFDNLALVLALAQSLPLVLRRRLPALYIAIVAGAFSADKILAYPSTFASVGLLPALYSAGAHQERFRRTLAVAATATYVGVAIVLHAKGSPATLFDFVSFYVVLLTFWGAGMWMRARQAREAAKRRREAESAVVEERARIARELHDVVTHHVTAMVVQADAAQFVLGTAPERAAAGLTAISGTGRSALAELRYLLGALNGPGDAANAERTPDLGTLQDLVDRTRLAGQPVELIWEGEKPPMGRGVELAAYRVVQEGLTNAVKYASGQPTTVHVGCTGAGVEIDVTTAWSATSTAAVHGGRGLAGLRERVRLFGGELSAGGQPGGAFTLRAGLPANDRD